MSVTVLASAALLTMPGVSASFPETFDTGIHISADMPFVEPGAFAVDSARDFGPVLSGKVRLPLPSYAQQADAMGAIAPSLEQISQQETIIVSGERAPAADPMQAVNQASYDAVQAVDGAVVAPLARGYEKAVPRPVRTGLRNFLLNLTEPIVALNFLLQLKPGKAVETVGRFAVNSTVGIGGLVDVAGKKPFKLPYRRNGFAYTMGYYGVGSGPYMFLPLVGPTSLRDVIGLGLDRFLLPFAVGGPLRHPAYVYGGFVVRSLDDRVENDALFKRISEESNPYASYREFYLKTRQAEIDALKGKADYQREGTIVLPPPPVAEPVAAPQPVAPERIFVSVPVIQPLPAGYQPQH